MSRQRLKVMIVDDEEPARRKLSELAADRSELEPVVECATAAEALRAIRTERPDLLFLDVRLPDRDSFELLDDAGGAGEVGVVFVSADGDLALRAFEVGAVDYLLKPVSRDAFERAVERAARLKAARAAGGNGAGAEPGGNGSGRLRRLLARDQGRIVVVPVEQVVRFEGDGNYVRLHCADAAYRVRATMTELESQLDPDHFFRVHRSTIVNLEHVRDLTHVIHGDYQVRLADGAEVILTGARRDAFTRALAGAGASAGA